MGIFSSPLKRNAYVPPSDAGALNACGLTRPRRRSIAV
jgi:hypothetical protein